MPIIAGGGASFTWTTSSGATAKSFTFAIPAGTYQSATWTLGYTYSTYSGSGTYQLQITVPGSGVTTKDAGRNVNASGSYSDTITVLVNDHISIINNYAGQTLSVTLLPVLISGSASWTNLNITTFTLNLTAYTNTFGKRWSADALDEHVIVSYVDCDANLYTSTHSGLGALTGGSLSTGWATKTNLASYAEDVNLGMFSSGRCYLTYTKSDIGKVTLSTQYRTNDQYGTGASSDWSAETAVPTTNDATDNHPTGGPFQQWLSKYVFSHSNNQGTSYFVRNYDRLALINPILYTVETDLVHGTYSSLNGPWVCTDQQGATWQWHNESGKTGGFWPGNYNSNDNLPRVFDNVAGTALADGYVGRQYNRIVGAPLVASPIVRTRHGVLAQIVYVTRYARVAPFSPNVFTMSNNDAVLGYKTTQAIDIAIPTDSNSISDADFCLDWNYAERTLTDCVVPQGNMPGSLKIPVPAMTGIPDPASTYGLTVWFDLDFTFKGASNFTIRIGTATTSTWGQTYPVSGRGEYNNSTRFYVDTTDLETIWMARGTTITLPITYSGTVEDLVIKSIKFEYDFYGSYYWTGAKITLNSVSNTSHITVERNPGTASTTSSISNNTEFRMSTIAVPSIVADMQAAAGSTYHATLTVDKGSPGSQPSTPYPYLFSVLDSFAVIDYNLSAYDFYMVRSRDGGRFWEFSNNCQPITQLADLKAFNALTTGSYSAPTLVASGDSIHAIWIENGAVKCISTQDQGDDWSS